MVSMAEHCPMHNQSWDFNILCKQENDVERAANLDRKHWDYCLEDMWRWIIASKSISIEFLFHRQIPVSWERFLHS